MTFSYTLVLIVGLFAQGSWSVTTHAEESFLSLSACYNGAKQIYKRQPDIFESEKIHLGCRGKDSVVENWVVVPK